MLELAIMQVLVGEMPAEGFACLDAHRLLAGRANQHIIMVEITQEIQPRTPEWRQDDDLLPGF